ncbi:MAG: hypothetical protein KDB03_14500 [Planctomycetales bacterium]|nr:hypothetical protein [Planctomycetales bacterium]
MRFTTTTKSFAAAVARVIASESVIAVIAVDRLARLGMRELHLRLMGWHQPRHQRLGRSAGNCELGSYQWGNAYSAHKRSEISESLFGIVDVAVCPIPVCVVGRQGS